MVVVVVAAADVGTAPKLFASLLAFLPPTNQRPILGAMGGKIINFLGHMINIWGLIYNISISSLIGLLFSPPIHTTTNTFLVISSQRFHCSLRLRVVGFSSPLTALESGLVEGASEKGAQIWICSIWEVDRNAATSNKNLLFQLILTNLVCLSALLCAIVNE